MEAAKVQECRVEVLQMRTETETVYANADGSLTTEVAAGPVRMVRDGKWVDVDLDLKRSTGGDVEAVAHPEHLKLAGAQGTLPKSLAAVAKAAPSQASDLVSLGKGADKIALQWKGGLPAPQLDGNQATYKDAVPEGDLVVEATRTGFEQVLRLNRAPRDGAPMVVPITVPEGTTAQQNADGSITLSDSSGEKSAVMPAPTMWDSRRDPRSLERTNSRRVDMSMRQDGTTVTLTLTPDVTWLHDATTQYPVTIDPAADALDVLFDTFVQGGDTTDQSANTDLKLGWPGDSEGGVKRVARSFVTFRIPRSGLPGVEGDAEAVELPLVVRRGPRLGGLGGRSGRLEHPLDEAACHEGEERHLHPDQAGVGPRMGERRCDQAGADLALGEGRHTVARERRRHSSAPRGVGHPDPLSLGPPTPGAPLGVARTDRRPMVSPRRSAVRRRRRPGSRRRGRNLGHGSRHPVHRGDRPGGGSPRSHRAVERADRLGRLPGGRLYQRARPLPVLQRRLVDWWPGWSLVWSGVGCLVMGP